MSSLESHNSKSGTILAFKKDVGDALLDACSFDPDDEAIMLMRVAKLVREEIFETKYHFNDPYAMNNITVHHHPYLH